MVSLVRNWDIVAESWGFRATTENLSILYDILAHEVQRQMRELSLCKLNECTSQGSLRETEPTEWTHTQRQTQRDIDNLLEWLTVAWLFQQYLSTDRKSKNSIAVWSMRLDVSDGLYIDTRVLKECLHCQWRNELANKWGQTCKALELPSCMFFCFLVFFVCSLYKLLWESVA